MIFSTSYKEQNIKYSLNIIDYLLSLDVYESGGEARKDNHLCLHLVQIY
ncbi:hypothetical protein AM1_D0235 (plasmid) [Acaryochloris marina MBIC11017]|uniref:Uncharacterized protein n=1 Tax=Acaryochloris marina (strain MBIC 11017) TaxID=329726 RepID=A8ZNZ2_ACAM1|nr:hypothetical protein AM1_D0235 [Acaryochloris marina MBIC11017]